MNLPSPDGNPVSQDPTKPRPNSIQLSPKNKRRKRKDGDGAEKYKPPQSAGLRNGFPHRRTRPLYNGRRQRPKVDDASPLTPSATAPDPGSVGAGLRRAKSMSRNARVRRIVRAKGLAALDLGGGARRPRAVTIGALPVRRPRGDAAPGGGGGGPGEEPGSGALPPGGGEDEGGAGPAAPDSDSGCDDASPGPDGRDARRTADGRSPMPPAVDSAVARFLRSSSPSRYAPGPIRTQPAFGLYAVPVMTALDVLSGAGGGRANARAAAKTDEAVMDELVEHFEGYGFGGERSAEGEATLDRYWTAPPRSASAASSSRGGSSVRGRGAPPPLPLHGLSAGGSVGMPSPGSLTDKKRWSSGVSSGISGASGGTGGTGASGGSGISGSGGSGTAHSGPLSGGANESQHGGAAKLETAGAEQIEGAAAAGSHGSVKGVKPRGTLASGGRSKLVPHWLPRASGKARMAKEAKRVRRPHEDGGPDAGAKDGATTADGSASPTSRGCQESDGRATGGKLSLRRLLPFGGRSSP
jgi:hypothetical protein